MRAGVDAFDADVLIYAAAPDHPLGRRVRRLFPDESSVGPGAFVGVGSVLLVPELLSKPIRAGHAGERDELLGLLRLIELRPVDAATADLATALSARHALRTVDAVHLATAVLAGADRFITNNRKDFGASITEIDVTHPGALPDP
jgi:predicted nucleic acid-binding protein